MYQKGPFLTQLVETENPHSAKNPAHKSLTLEGIIYPLQLDRVESAGGGASLSLVDGRRGAVLLLADVLTPRDGTALLVDFLHRELPA
jgi:hypothetical protein